MELFIKKKDKKAQVDKPLQSPEGFLYKRDDGGRGGGSHRKCLKYS